MGLISFFNRLSVRFTLLIVLLIVLPAGISIGVVGNRIKRDFRETALRQFAKQLDIKADRAEALLEIAKGEVEAFVVEINQDFKELNKPGEFNVDGAITPAFFKTELYREFVRDLKVMMLRSRFFLQSRLIDASGQEIIRYDRTDLDPALAPKEKLLNKSKRDYFRHIVDRADNDVYVAPISLNRESGEITVPHTPMLRIGQKITLPDGRLFGTVVLNVHADMVFGLRLLEEGSTFLVIDNGGSYLHHWNKAVLFGKDLGHSSNLLAEEPELKANLQKQESRIHYDDELKEFRVWRKVFFDEGDSSKYWVFMERQLESSILAPWFDPVENGTAGLAIILIAGFFLYALLAHKFLSPLQYLTTAIKNMEEGDLSGRVKVKSSTEVGNIASAYNSMADRLEQSIREERQTMEKLKKANEEIKSFANIVSHDLRSPLVNLKGFSGELKEAFAEIKQILEKSDLGSEQKKRIDELMQEDMSEAFGFIDSSTKAMERLISGILRLAQIGVRKLDYIEIDTKRLVDEKLKTMSHQIESRKLKVIVSGLPNVVADEVCMDQIFGNILSNAINYTDPNRPGLIEITGERRADDILFKIADNGIGIADYARSKVFEIFRRGVGKDIPGEGMGLAYVKALVERHNGKIWFESKEGEGTIFYFTISDKLKS